MLPRKEMSQTFLKEKNRDTTYTWLVVFVTNSIFFLCSSLTRFDMLHNLYRWLNVKYKTKIVPTCCGACLLNKNVKYKSATVPTSYDACSPQKKSVCPIQLRCLPPQEKKFDNVRTYPVIFFLETQYKHKRSHTRTYTHPYEHTHVHPTLWAPLKDWADGLGLEIDEVTTGTSLLTGTSPLTERIFRLYET
jgi:hypothetical protein